MIFFLFAAVTEIVAFTTLWSGDIRWIGRVYDIVQDVVTWSNRCTVTRCVRLPFDNRSRASLRPLLSSNPHAIKFSIDGTMSFVNNIDWLYQFCLTECRPWWRANVVFLSFFFPSFSNMHEKSSNRSIHEQNNIHELIESQFYTVARENFINNIVVVMILVNWWYWSYML